MVTASSTGDWGGSARSGRGSRQRRRRRSASLRRQHGWKPIDIPHGLKGEVDASLRCSGGKSGADGSSSGACGRYRQRLLLLTGCGHAIVVVMMLAMMELLVMLVLVVKLLVLQLL